MDYHHDNDYKLHAVKYYLKTSEPHRTWSHLERLSYD